MALYLGSNEITKAYLGSNAAQLYQGSTALFPAAFDPTFGGTITPYYWFDFTDESTMTLSGTEITAISNKGSVSNSLTRPQSTGPNFNGSVAEFRGTSSTSNKLAIDDSSLTAFSISNGWTILFFLNPTLPAFDDQQARILNLRSSTYAMPDDGGILMNVYTNSSTFPFYSNYNNKLIAGSTSPIAGDTVIGGQNGPSSNGTYTYYNLGSTAGPRGYLAPYLMSSTSTTKLISGIQTSTNKTDAQQSTSDRTNSAYGFTIGGRANPDAGTQNFDLAHTVAYDFELSDAQLDGVISSFPDLGTL